MKNFKLLLATTAMLSMGAMAVNAEYNTGITGKVNVSVDLIYNLRVANDNPLRFGSILNPTTGQTVTIGYNSDTTSGTANVIPVPMAPHRGEMLVEGLPPQSQAELLVPTESLWLKNKRGEYCGKVDLITDNGAGSMLINASGSSYYGGTFTFVAPEGETLTTESSNCSVQTEATLVLW